MLLSRCACVCRTTKSVDVYCIWCVSSCSYVYELSRILPMRLCACVVTIHGPVLQSSHKSLMALCAVILYRIFPLLFVAPHPQPPHTFMPPHAQPPHTFMPPHPQPPHTCIPPHAQPRLQYHPLTRHSSITSHTHPAGWGQQKGVQKLHLRSC